MKTRCYKTRLGAITIKVEGDVLHYLQFEKQVEYSTEQSPIIDKVLTYLEGSIKDLEIPFQLKGTPFQEQVWDIINTIPYGKTISYNTIAKQLGDAKKVRAVGAAVGANPVLIIVPCHRVIASNGALQGYSGGIENKQKLLTIEGVLQQTTLF